ncbi:MAG: RAMP superfamily CRISPR-associated protein, partial [bacterium]
MSDAERKNLLGRYRHLLRVVIELASPLSIGTGDDTLDAANAVARDANDLPTIPGTSLAGVLRAAWGGEADALFGYQRRKVRTGRNDEAPAEAQRSRLRVSWGSVHGQDDRPVQGLVPPASIEADPVLAAARGVVRRDHVRLNHRGVADGRGKHDRASVMAGHRFSFELEVMSDDPADDTLAKVVALL